MNVNSMKAQSLDRLMTLKLRLTFMARFLPFFERIDMNERIGV